MQYTIKKYHQLIVMQKKNISSHLTRNRIIDNIISRLIEDNEFLLLGHKNPDDDCISSMVAMALLIRKFHKNAAVYISEETHEHFSYLLNICEYNSIHIINKKNILNKTHLLQGIDTIVLCDTAKRDMIDCHNRISPLFERRGINKVEIDHHIGADSEYFGDAGYRLVMDATSASELVGLIVLRLLKKKKILRKHRIGNPLSRNIILSILTGIVGDTNMGKYLKSSRDRRYYEIFSGLYNNLLGKETVKKTNIASINEVYKELSRLSKEEESCYTFMMNRKQSSPSIGYIVLDEHDVDTLLETVDSEVLVAVSRAVADALAEESGRLSLVAYADSDTVSELVQFRVRRSHQFKDLDLRSILGQFSITNGGGHEGAIGFRVPKDSIDDIRDYVHYLVNGIEEALS